MSVHEDIFGKLDNGTQVNIYTLKNSNGVEAKIINYGGAVVSLKVPDKNNNFEDVVLGYDNLESYINGDKFFGALIGRCGNRIEYGKFKINGVEYNLATNNGNNHLHGGIKGYDKVIWNVKTIDEKSDTLELSYLSKDGEENYPGNLNVTVTYTITEDNSLKIDYKAVSDKDTVVNLTNHSYFNLSGHASGDILNHELMINADKFTVNDKYSIPHGETRDVAESPMDFRTLTTIGKNIDADYDQIIFGSGYDHNWILNTNGDVSKLAAKVVDEKSGRVMEVYTTTPGVQFYSSNFLDGSDIGKGGTPYNRRTGICLETQYVPNAINLKNVKSTLLKAGEEYKHTTIYKFSVL